MNITAIDPGLSGGIASIRDECVTAIAMPDTLVDIHSMIYITYADVCYIEKVHASPQMGAHSAFTFGKNFGALLGILTVLEIKIVEVNPEVWMRALGCVSKMKDPSGTKKLAQKLFPEIKVTNKTADALLIAEYGRRKEVASIS